MEVYSSILNRSTNSARTSIKLCRADLLAAMYGHYL